jgi:hypothetical protein
MISILLLPPPKKRRDDRCWFCERGQDDQISRPTPLPQCHVGGSESGGVGRKEPRRDTGPAFESVLGIPAAAVLRVIRSEEESRGGEDEDEAHAARMDDWIVWEAEGTGGRDL